MKKIILMSRSKKGTVAPDYPVNNITNYYKFDTATGLTDNQGNQDLAQITGGTDVTFTLDGKSNQAANTALGNDSGLEAPSTMANFGNGTTDTPFSFSFYINPVNSGGGIGWLISKRAAADYEYQLISYNGDLNLILFSGNGNTNDISAKIAYSFVASTWAHLTVTYDGSGNNTGINIYIDGVKQTLTPGGNGTYVAMSSSNAKFRLYDPEWSTSFSVRGRCDGLGIWDAELTQSQVTAIYDVQNAGNDLI